MKKTQYSIVWGRLVRNIIIYTLICLLIGFCIGISIEKPITVVEATSEPSVAENATVEPITNVISLGVCKVTAYCMENYPHICNDGDSTQTSTGATPTVGRTVAVDPSVVPYGSEVIINGHTYLAEDCGGAIKGNRVDILFATHQEALDFGIQYVEVCYVGTLVGDISEMTI